MEKSFVVPERPTGLERYQAKSKSSLAVLLTDTDSAWLGLAHGLKTIGIPFTITTDVREAIEHKVVLVYPTISGHLISQPDLKALAAIPRQGGTLVAYEVLGGGLNEVFGFTDVVSSHDHYEINFSSKAAAHWGLNDPREIKIPLGSRNQSDDRLGSLSYLQAQTHALAFYEDGSSAVIHRAVGHGHAYAFGIDLGALFLKGYNNRDQWIERDYVNSYEPVIDVFLRILKEIYKDGENNAVIAGTVPNGKSLSVLITHDIDYAKSVQNAVAYAAYENENGIQATYFLQTKTVQDYNDIIFFTPKEIPAIRRLYELGMEIGSHSVSHSKVFNKFPLGSGEEKYPGYLPFVKSAIKTENGTILGELRVSKFLIEKTAGIPEVISFRPGELSNPYALPQALKATGYRFSSSVTANNSLTHLPFQMNYNRETRAELNIYEFPVTVEDEAPPAMLQRLPAAVELAKKISRFGGLFVLLIHPNITGEKLEFEKKFITAVSEESWFGTVAQFGAWWSARDHVRFGAEPLDLSRTALRLEIPDAIEGLSFFVPPKWNLDRVEPESLKAEQRNEQVTIGYAQGNAILYFKMK